MVVGTFCPFGKITTLLLDMHGDYYIHMNYKRTTYIPNALFDTKLPMLTGSELKIILIVLRRTNGWLDPKTGKRKKRARISYKQFQKATGLSKWAVMKAVNSLIKKRLIQATDYYGKELLAEQKQGNWCIYYASLIGEEEKTYQVGKKNNTRVVRKVIPIKTNSNKLNKDKLSEQERIEIVKAQIREMLGR